MALAGDITGTEGTAYGVQEFNGPGDPDIIMPIGAKSRAVALRAPEDNAGPVYLGWDDQVTVNNGFPLAAGDGFGIDLDNTQQTVWAVSANANDELRFMLME